MWAVILEKAFAKLHGNYQHLIGGDPREAARALTGAPSIQYMHHKKEVTEEVLWAELLKHDASNNMIFMNSLKEKNGAKRNKCGLSAGHAYVALEAIEMENGARLIKMRNPWGTETYKCDYSDSSSLWSPYSREEAGATKEAVNEGIFFMTVEDFYNQAESTVISFDTTSWSYDYFLMLDDQTKSPGDWDFCGETCTRHKVNVTSSIDQPVYLTVHTWDQRSYPKECQKKNKAHSIYMQGDFKIEMFRDGTHQMKPVEFSADDEIQFVLEFDWDRECVTPDWSITAWASNGTVSVTHSEGLDSDKMPVLDTVRHFKSKNSTALTVIKTDDPRKKNTTNTDGGVVETVEPTVLEE